MNKTNKKWYPTVSMGSYYKLENGNLYFSPMLINGKRDIEVEGEVDSCFLKELDSVINNLKTKL